MTIKLKPPCTLLMGGTGSGKSYSLATYIEAGLQLVVIGTEPTSYETVIDAIQAKGLPVDMLNYAYVPFASTTWDAFEDLIKKVGMMGYDDLSKLKHGMSKAEYRQMYTLYETLSDFKCQLHGTHLGPIDELDDTYAVALDSLSGINQMCKDLMVGAKPTMHEGEWGTAMNVEERLINKFTSDLNCFFCLTAHLDKQVVEVEGRMMRVPAMLGKKLGPVVPRMFSDVIVARREGNEWMWSNIEMDTDTKSRNLPYSNKLEPSFVPIVNSYRNRKEMIEAGKIPVLGETD